MKAFSSLPALSALALALALGVSGAYAQSSTNDVQASPVTPPAASSTTPSAASTTTPSAASTTTTPAAPSSSTDSASDDRGGAGYGRGYRPGPGMMNGPGAMRGHRPGYGYGYGGGYGSDEGNALDDRGSGYGPGMMRGYGPGYGMGRGGYGQGPGFGGPGGGGCGWGAGPGMMGGPGWGMGPGMMGPGMMGPGMMGPGMGGPGWGRGTMGPWGALASLDLDDSQRKQLRDLHQQQRRKHWALMGQMQEEMEKLQDAWGDGAGTPDRAAILAANRRISDLRQQMLESRLDAAEQFDKILRPEQREQLRSQREAGQGRARR